MTSHFAFVLVPGFSLLALSGAVEALRAANVAARRPLYRWTTVHPGDGPVASSSGLPLPTVPLAEADTAVNIAVCGGERSHEWHSPPLADWLRTRALRGARVGALSDGSFLVAAAGLFARHRSTIHWKCLDAYRERFPRLDIRATVFELDEKRFSCAGGTAALDLFLNIIQREHGQALAAEVADNYIHDRIRDAGHSQRLSAFYHLLPRSARLARAVQLMEQAVETPWPMDAIAAGAGVSSRQLDRLFRRHLDDSPARYYRRLRLAHARRLLVQTNLSVAEIAAATGFSSAAHFARCFRALYGHVPSAHRRTALVPQGANRGQGTEPTGPQGDHSGRR